MKVPKLKKSGSQSLGGGMPIGEAASVTGLIGDD